MGVVQRQLERSKILGREEKIRFPLVKNKRNNTHTHKSKLKYEEVVWMKNSLSCVEQQIREELFDKAAK